MLRHIFKRESIQIVHGHAAFSALAHEALFVGSLLGLGKKMHATLPCLVRKYIFIKESGNTPPDIRFHFYRYCVYGSLVVRIC